MRGACLRQVAAAAAGAAALAAVAAIPLLPGCTAVAAENPAETEQCDASQSSSASAGATCSSPGTGGGGGFGEIGERNGEERERKKVWDVVAVTDDQHYDRGQWEDLPLLESLERLGRVATRVSIQNATFDFSTAKAVVIRSAWGKYEYLDKYWDFIREMDADPTLSLFNPGSMFQWHGKKSVYLKELSEYPGINVPKTVWIMHDVRHVPKLEDIAQELGCDQLVMKPATGNAGHGIQLVSMKKKKALKKKQRHLYYLVRGHKWNSEWAKRNELFYKDDWELVVDPVESDDVMVQCYQEQIVSKCERGVIFIGGEVTHGVRKCPTDGEFKVHEAYGGTTEVYNPMPDEVEFAKKVGSAISALIGEPVTYLRVDVINDNDDELALMEVAAGTAQLWLAKRPQAADVFANYLDAYLRRREEAGVSYGAKDKELPEASAVDSTPRFNFAQKLEDTVDKVENGTHVLVWWDTKDPGYYEAEIIDIKHYEKDGTADKWLWKVDYGPEDLNRTELIDPFKHNVYIPLTKDRKPFEGSTSNDWKA